MTKNTFSYCQGGSSFQTADVEFLTKRAQGDDKFSGVDILMTTAWPKDITKYTSGNVSINQVYVLIISE